MNMDSTPCYADSTPSNPSRFFFVIGVSLPLDPIHLLHGSCRCKSQVFAGITDYLTVLCILHQTSCALMNLSDHLLKQANLAPVPEQLHRIQSFFFLRLTRQACTRSVILELFVDSGLKIWTTPSPANNLKGSQH